MRDTNRQIRIILLALTLGVWGLIARSFFPPTTGSASQPTAAKRVYVASLTFGDRGEGIVSFDNSPGHITLDRSQMVFALNEAARRGIKVHSVISPSDLGRYTVFVEK
ncbi:MAG: hypothetical protein ACREA2_17595 [Blastocatellia bacterium]